MERKPFIDRMAAMSQEANLWQPAWKDIQRFLAPKRGSFTDTDPNATSRMIDHKTILDGYQMRALNTLASGMTSGLTSPSRPWFKLGLPDKSLELFQPVKEWLSDVQGRMMAVFSASNLYGALPWIYAETGAFGTGALMVVRDFKTVIRCINFTCGEYFLAIGDDGRVNAFGRRFWKTVGQLVAEFGEANVSESVRNAWTIDKATDKRIKVNHLIEENDTRVVGDATFRGKKYRSVYWEEGSSDGQEKFLRVGGFGDFPVMAPRWQLTTTNDIYGTSPGWETLGDIKMLQKMQKDSLLALDKVVDPPMQADGNVVDQVNTLPGGITRSSSMSPNAGVRPTYQIQPDFAAIEAKIERTQRAIGAAFFEDLFKMMTNIGPDRTAREIVERHEEKLLMLGPVLERHESELLDPLIDRVFNIMNEDGLLPPPPEEMQGMALDVTYISMLAQAQKMVGTTVIEQGAAFIGSLAAANPDALDKLDTDETIDAYGDALGLPPKMIRSKERVAEIRKAKQDAAKAAQMAAAMPAMVDGAKTLSETKVGQNSALDALLAGAGGSATP